MDITPIVIAIAGVLGTLVAPIVTQKLSMRARTEEFKMQEKQRHDDRIDAEQTRLRTEKRQCYVSILATARQYRYEIVRYFYAIRASSLDSEIRADLEKARQAYVVSFAEVQLSASPKAFDVMELINAGLSQAYRAVKALEDERLGPSSDIENPESYLNELWAMWSVMREAMREDLPRLTSSV